MPVHSAQKEGILVITVDGDFTSSELRRVGAAAVAHPDTRVPARILLDVSGAAGLKNHPSAGLMETADFFASMALGAMAVLAPDDTSHGLMRMGLAMYAVRGIRAEVFRNRPEAMEWLNAEASS